MKLKKNTISLIIAKKGSGKSVLATSLALSQNKKTFYITPIKRGFYTLAYDSINWNDFNRSPLQIAYIECNDRERINYLLDRIKRIANNTLGGVLIVIDEIDYYSGSKLSFKSSIFDIVNYGRHLQLDLIFIARRIQDVPKNVVTNSDYIYLGKNNNIANDVKYYRDFFNENVIEYSKSLPEGKFLRVDSQGEDLSKVYITEQAFQVISTKARGD